MAAQSIASLDGRIAPTAETVIPLPDDGLFRGDGVFEVIRLYAGRPFELAAHLDRLQRSAAAIELPVERSPLEREIEALLERNGDADAQLRLIVTRGGRRLCMIEPLKDWGPDVSLATVTYAPTVILTGVKSLSYGANMLSVRPDYSGGGGARTGPAAAAPPPAGPGGRRPGRPTRRPSPRRPAAGRRC